jgi:hypothetical protein
MKKYIFAILIALPGFVFAQTESHLKAGEKFLDVSGVKAGFDSMLDASLKSQIGSIPLDKQEKFTQVMKEFMNKYFTFELIKPKFVKIYTDEFTEKELNDLIKFYSSPTGKKLAEKLPGLTQKGMEVGLSSVQEHQKELEEMMKKAFSPE